MQRGDLTKMITIAILTLFLVFVVAQIYIFYGKAEEAKTTWAAAKARLDASRADHDKLQSELGYFSNPENFAKEIRARFNYHALGEKTLILVPQATSTSD